MTTLYFVRHCEALGNQQQIFQGSYDGPVTERGREQLRHLSQRFADIPLDAVYTSPLSRACDTARAVIGDRNIPLYIEPRMREINGGDWERVRWAELLKQNPTLSHVWLTEPWKFQAPHGETMVQVYERVKDAVQELAFKHDGQRIAIASHGCAIRNALCYIHGLAVTQLNEMAWSDNTAVSLVRFDNGRWSSEYENDNSHLPEGASQAEKQSWWRTAADPSQ